MPYYAERLFLKWEIACIYNLFWDIED